MPLRRRIMPQLGGECGARHDGSVDAWRGICCGNRSVVLTRRGVRMPRAMWKGSIAFGLVNIPIELYSATRDHRPRFKLLHAKDESPVHYDRVCEKEGKPVAWEDLVKGYEY